MRLTSAKFTIAKWPPLFFLELAAIATFFGARNDYG